jgi:hypothetical protein
MRNEVDRQLDPIRDEPRFKSIERPVPGYKNSSCRAMRLLTGQRQLGLTADPMPDMRQASFHTHEPPDNRELHDGELICRG